MCSGEEYSDLKFFKPSNFAQGFFFLSLQVYKFHGCFLNRLLTQSIYIQISGTIRWWASLLQSSVFVVFLWCFSSSVKGRFYIHNHLLTKETWGILGCYRFGISSLTHWHLRESVIQSVSHESQLAEDSLANCHWSTWLQVKSSDTWHQLQRYLRESQRELDWEPTAKLLGMHRLSGAWHEEPE